MAAASIDTRMRARLIAHVERGDDARVGVGLDVGAVHAIVCFVEGGDSPASDAGQRDAHCFVRWLPVQQRRCATSIERVARHWHRRHSTACLGVCSSDGSS